MKDTNIRAAFKWLKKIVASNWCPICKEKLEYDFRQFFYYCGVCGFNHSGNDTKSVDKSA